jgi:hypothetical protein
MRVCVKLVNFATSKNLTVKRTMLLHCNIHKFTWPSPDGKTHNQIDYILKDQRCHSSVPDVRLFMGVDCDIDPGICIEWQSHNNVRIGSRQIHSIITCLYSR